MAKRVISGKQYKYDPVMIDQVLPMLVLKGEPIERGATVTVVNSRPDPLGHFAWIKDEYGNVQSINKTSLVSL